MPKTPRRRPISTLRALLLALPIGLAAAGGCASTQPPTSRPVNLSPQALPAGSFAQQVPVDLDIPEGDSVADLHLLGGSLYVQTKGNYVYALTAGGTPKFVLRVADEGESVYAPLLVDANPGAATAGPANATPTDALLVFPTPSALEVYEPGGKKVRSVQTTYSIRSEAATGLGLVYGGVDTPNGGRLAAYDPDREYANLRWSVQEGAVRARPAFYGGVVFFGTTAGRVYAVFANQTTPWGGLASGYFQTDAEITAGLAADEFGVYVAGTDKKLYALDRATGKVRWYYFAQAPLTAAPVATADAVYQLVPGAGIVKIDKVKGEKYRKPAWTAPGATQFLSQDAANVYLATGGGEFAAFDKATGERKFAAKLPGMQRFATNLTNAMIYAVDETGRVRIIRPILSAGQVGLLVK